MKIGMLLLFTGMLGVSSTDKKAVQLNEEEGFAVIELFSSEGCSSCPPADALISRIQKEMTALPDYILSFQVDYWDRLGWKDPYSHPDFSRRQRQYASWLHLSSVYTPQVVINGQKELVGSNETLLRRTIGDYLHKKSTAQLSIKRLQRTSSAYTLSYEVDNAGDQTSLLIALVQKLAATNVKRGENGGKTLSHVQVVRNLKRIDLNDKSTNTGTASLNIPENTGGQAWEVIAFVQRNGTGEIVSAARLNAVSH